MASSPDELSAELILCDWAEALNGKLYIQGGGWTRIKPGVPVQIAIAALVHVPYTQTNKKHTLVLTLTTEDGDPFPGPDPRPRSRSHRDTRPHPLPPRRHASPCAR